MNLNFIRCTVLNSDYNPLSVVSAKRGLVLAIKGKATISEEHPDHMIHFGNGIWPVPTQVVLKEYVKSRSPHRVKAILTQRNLFLRDSYRCGYCNRHRSELKPSEFLTRDHVHPKTLGGLDTWTNVVCSCNTCNNKKADLPLEKTNMKLNKIPIAPSIYELMARAGSRKK